MDEKTLARFWSKVERTEGCWLWKSTVTRDGYGLFQLNGKTTRVTRLSWLVHHGEIPPRGVNVLHRCDVPNCVRKEHLFLGTQKDNAVDMASKLRGGHQKLTAAQVREIRQRFDAGELQRVIAADFGITRETARDIGKRLKWRWLPE